MHAYDITFTLVEWLSITGLLQCIMILVYILFRVSTWQQIILPVMYFLVLGASFLLQFSLRLDDFSTYIRLALSFFWSLQIIFGYLLILQIIHLNRIPHLKHFFVISFIFIIIATVLSVNHFYPICTIESSKLIEALSCSRALQWFDLGVVFSGCLCLLFLWANRGLFSQLFSSQQGHERYWLVMSLILINVLLICVYLSYLSGHISLKEADLMKVAFRLSFVYLTTTMLFRIYPSPINLVSDKTSPSVQKKLNDEELDIADKVKTLLDFDKIYHEASYSRSDLARELNIPETILSKVINNAFHKTLPQLLNAYRVEDAKRMLKDKDIPIKVVAFEVGFNSLASFNRVFKEESGISPSIYRNEES